MKIEVIYKLLILGPKQELETLKTETKSVKICYQTLFNRLTGPSVPTHVLILEPLHLNPDMWTKNR